MTRAFIAVFCFLAMSLSSNHVLASTTASASSGAAAGKKASVPGESVWRYWDPTPKDVIEFTSGRNAHDGVFVPKKYLGPYTKFDFPAAGGVAGIPLTDGFDRKTEGACGSVAESVNWSTSYKALGSRWGWNWYCGWACAADGVLGKPENCNTTPYWSAETEVKDPRVLTSMSFDTLGINESYYDLFFTVGLDSAEYSPRGSVQLTASYETVSGVINVLNINLSESGVTITNDAPSGLSIYRLTSLTEGPTENPDSLRTLSAIQSSLTADLAGDRVLDNPIYLGLVWQDIPVPTLAIDSTGAVAKIHVDTRTTDRARGVSGRSHFQPEIARSSGGRDSKRDALRFGVSPNPFVDEATFTYSLSSPARVEINVFDPAGRRVATLTSESQGLGTDQVTWRRESAVDLVTGVYFVQLVVDGRPTESLKLVHLRR